MIKYGFDIATKLQTSLDSSVASAFSEWFTVILGTGIAYWTTYGYTIMQITILLSRGLVNLQELLTGQLMDTLSCRLQFY